MKTLRFDILSSALVAGLLTLTACPGDDDPGDTGAGTDTDDGSSTGTPDPTTGSPTTDDPTATTTDPTATTTDDPTATTGDPTATTGDTDPLPNGSECTENEECESGMCFFNSLFGGVCGECLTEEDCPDGGCTPPNPLPEPPVPATCNDGSLGGGCNTDEACQEELSCIDLIEVPGIIEVATCGECNEDTECSDDWLCAPQFDIANFTGQKSCVEPGSVPNGQGCDHEGSGDDQCMSGICAEVDLMGLLTVGVCGECNVDADCTEAGETCQEPDVDIETGEVTPPLCG